MLAELTRRFQEEYPNDNVKSFIVGGNERLVIRGAAIPHTRYVTSDFIFSTPFGMLKAESPRSVWGGTTIAVAGLANTGHRKRRAFMVGLPYIREEERAMLYRMHIGQVVQTENPSAAFQMVRMARQLGEHGSTLFTLERAFAE
jgi:hypothetical protein